MGEFSALVAVLQLALFMAWVWWRVQCLERRVDRVTMAMRSWAERELKAMAKDEGPRA